MISLGLPKSHFFLKLSQNEKASEASGATKTKHLWVQSHRPPHSGRKTGRDQKTLSILSQNDLRKKGVDHDEISFP